MRHYVCPSCGGVSNSPKNCDTNGCHLHGQPLVECNCADDRHKEILGDKEQADV